MSPGYVFQFAGHGAFSPEGAIAMTEEESKAHNARISAGVVEHMAHAGIAVLYLLYRPGAVSQGERYQVGTWDGSHKWNVSQFRKGRHNMAGSRLDVWFTGPDGKTWHGCNLGDNDIVRCRANKG